MPHSRVTGNIRPEVKGLKASPPGAKILVAQPDASSLKTVSQGRSTGERDNSFLSVNTRFSGKSGVYNGNSNRKKKDDSIKSTFQHYSSALKFSTTIHRYSSVL